MGSPVKAPRFMKLGAGLGWGCGTLDDMPAATIAHLVSDVTSRLSDGGDNATDDEREFDRF
jgi:hypothetical protein